MSGSISIDEAEAMFIRFVCSACNAGHRRNELDSEIFFDRDSGAVLGGIGRGEIRLAFENKCAESLYDKVVHGLRKSRETAMMDLSE